ncbi:hypothetical protein Tco_0944947 [Tanacetum coccineum]
MKSSRRASEKKLNPIELISQGMKLISGVHETMAKAQLKIDLVKNSKVNQEVESYQHLEDLVVKHIEIEVVIVVFVFRDYAAGVAVAIALTTSESVLTDASSSSSTNVIAKQQRIPNKNKKYTNKVAQEKSMMLRRFMDLRSSVIQVSIIERSVAGASAGMNSTFVRIGAVDKKETKKPQEAPVVEEEAYEFVDYKDRKEALAKKESTEMDVDLGLENAAPVSVESSPAGVDIAAEDAVTLLLRHSRGVQAMDDEVMRSGEGDTRADKGKKGKRKAKKVLGPERPSFLDGETDYESWVPPQGQSGDGRTSLNDRLGY